MEFNLSFKAFNYDDAYFIESVSDSDDFFDKERFDELDESI